MKDRFDLVMFSESFQYITLDTVLGDAMRRHRCPAGTYLICDFFKTGAPGKSVIGGGHPVAKFEAALQKSGLEVLEDIDITRETAPNLDLVDQMGRELLYPTFNLIGYAFGSNHPWLAKISALEVPQKARQDPSQVSRRRAQREKLRAAQGVPPAAAEASGPNIGMAWWGKALGGAFGFLIGGPLGALAGIAFGHSFDRGLKGLDGGEHVAEQERIQAAFFHCNLLGDGLHRQGRRPGHAR